jgi:hypothetical protein
VKNSGRGVGHQEERLMDRETALKAIQENEKNENLIKHMLAVKAIMRALRGVALIPILKKAISESNFL